MYELFDEIYDALFADTEAMQDNIDICLTEGCIGDMLPNDIYPEKYKIYINTEDNMFYGGDSLWDKYGTHKKLLSTQDIVVYKKGDINSTMTDMKLVNFLDRQAKKFKPEAIWDMKKKRLEYLKDITIVKLPVFDEYNKAATKIQRMWRQWIARRHAAATVIQHAVLAHLYHPSGNIANKLQLDFYVVASA
jgi:hypothetical protein